MISIIIPTFNEEKYLPGLLESIISQDLECEIIIPDCSSDSTRDIARKFGCQVIQGGRPSIARNNGARSSKNSLLLFLDADIILPKGFIKNFLEEAQDYDYATCYLLPDSKKWDHRFYYFLKNWFNHHNPVPHVSGQCLLIMRSLFEKVGGYDETIMFGEEHELAYRLKGFKRFFSKDHVLAVPRRLEKEGTFRTLAKDIYSELFRLFSRGDKNIYNKKYGHYSYETGKSKTNNKI